MTISNKDAVSRVEELERMAQQTHPEIIPLCIEELEQERTLVKDKLIGLAVLEKFQSDRVKKWGYAALITAGVFAASLIAPNVGIDIDEEVIVPVRYVSLGIGAFSGGRTSLAVANEINTSGKLVAQEIYHEWLSGLLEQVRTTAEMLGIQAEEV
jgi:hypothetical protein